MSPPIDPAGDPCRASPVRAPCGGGRDPLWLYLLAGWLLASTQLGPARDALSASQVRARSPLGVLEPAERDPDRMDLRELRRLPAIGPTRALEIVRARWERGLAGGPEAWEELSGIGPETVRTIRAELDRGARVVSDPPPP